MSGERLRGFEPIWRADARVLILGSMPSVASLAQGFYYAHPRNAFWPMLADILGEPLPADAAGKRRLLISHRIALWDSACSCEREGSLDSGIRRARAGDFAALYARCPEIRRILFNGAAAEVLYRRLVKDADPRHAFVRLPSTSPAYTLKYENKRAAWQQALKEAFLDESL